MKDLIVVSVIVLIFFSISYAVIKTASEIQENVTIKEVKVEEPTLPEKCRDLYYNGTNEDWFKCMGVEYK